jgi:hypothetical protein
MAGGWSQSAGLCFAQDFGGLTGINATPSATVNTKGSWISMGTLITSCSSFLFRIAYVNAGQADYGCSVDIGIGTSGSQFVLMSNINVSLQPAGLGQAAVWQHAIPVGIAQGQQIWVRSAVNVASFTGSVLCWFTPYDNSFVSFGECCGLETLGASATAGRGTGVTAGTTQSGTKGSYVQLGTATRDYIGFLVNQDMANNTSNESGNMLDIAIGAAGSQIVILADLEIYQGGVESPSDFEFVAIPIPAGSAVWGRAASIAPDTSLGLTLYGVF